MKCPNCNSNTKVVDLVNDSKKKVRYRKRVCKKCGFIFYTSESIIVFDQLKKYDWNNNYRKSKSRSGDKKQMSAEYDRYLIRHKGLVGQAYEWIKTNLPELILDNYDYQILCNHDLSKSSNDEYEAYDEYFYGQNKSSKTINRFNEAWLRHIQRNPHHWQHWVLLCDDPKEGTKLIEIPYNYIIEMICDWWSFSWNTGNLYEIFDWYDEHKEYIQINPNSRKTVEKILSKIKEKLTENK